MGYVRNHVIDTPNGLENKKEKHYFKKFVTLSFLEWRNFLSEV